MTTLVRNVIHLYKAHGLDTAFIAEALGLDPDMPVAEVREAMRRHESPVNGEVDQ